MADRHQGQLTSLRPQVGPGVAPGGWPWGGGEWPTGGQFGRLAGTRGRGSGCVGAQCLGDPIRGGPGGLLHGLVGEYHVPEGSCRIRMPKGLHDLELITARVGEEARIGVSEVVDSQGGHPGFAAYAIPDLRNRRHPLTGLRRHEEVFALTLSPEAVQHIQRYLIEHHLPPLAGLGDLGRDMPHHVLTVDIHPLGLQSFIQASARPEQKQSDTADHAILIGRQHPEQAFELFALQRYLNPVVGIEQLEPLDWIGFDMAPFDRQRERLPEQLAVVIAGRR